MGKTAKSHDAGQQEKTDRSIPPEQLVDPPHSTKTPTGEQDKRGPKPILLALTVGSTSTRGSVPVTVLSTRHLPMGTPADMIDPPYPPAKGSPSSQSLAINDTVLTDQQVSQYQKPHEALMSSISGRPARREPQAPAVLRLAHNSNGVKEGSEQPLPATPMPDSDMQIGDGSGLKGDYFTGRQFNQLVMSRGDSKIDWDWIAQPDKSPCPKIPAYTDYTVRWTGRIAAQYSETYTFYAAADDGVRVWINHHLVIDDWSPHPLTQFSGQFTFVAGEQYLFKCEYLEIDGGEASVYVYWSSPHTPKQYVPEDAFFYPLPTDEEDLQQDHMPW
jgi:hypothetical protein